MPTLRDLEEGDEIRLSPAIEEYTYIEDYSEPIIAKFVEVSTRDAVVEFESIGKTQSIKPEHLIPICQNCNSRKLYHDTKEKWYCPWCNIE